MICRKRNHRYPTVYAGDMLFTPLGADSVGTRDHLEVVDPAYILRADNKCNSEPIVQCGDLVIILNSDISYYTSGFTA